jgi:hypothetical protein
MNRVTDSMPQDSTPANPGADRLRGRTVVTGEAFPLRHVAFGLRRAA